MIGCVGDVVLDVSVRLKTSARSDTDTPARIHHRQGGSAANVAAEAARLSGKSRFIGVIGADTAGDRLSAELQKQGVEICGPRIGRTGCVVALLNEAGEATMLTDRGDAAQLCEWHPKWLDGLTALHVTSYAFFAEPMATTAKSLIAEAQTQGIPVSIDVSSVGAISDFGLARYAELLHDLQPDILFANASEAELLVSEKGLVSQSFTSKSPKPQDDPSEKHPEAQTVALLLSLAKAIVIKQGPNPVILLSREPLANDKTKLEIPVPKLEKVTDTLAAGDTFAAGFLVAKTVKNLSWEEAVIAAIDSASNLLASRNRSPHLV